jgi:uncharacterized protein with FMN-binding domain
MNSDGQKKVMAVVGLLCIVAVIGAGLALASPKNGTSNSSSQSTSSTATNSPSPQPSSSATTQSSYKDGTYSATGSYRTPETTESLAVSLTLKQGVVTDANVSGKPQAHETEEYQAQFLSGYKPLVVGKKLNDINLSNVSGSSLTPKGFNDAVSKIKTQAAG